MEKYLKKIRARSDKEKTSIVRTFALLTTGIIFIIYVLLVTFLPQYNQPPVVNTQQDAFNAFSNVLNEGIDQISNEMQERSNQLNLNNENLPFVESQFEIDSPTEENIENSPEKNTSETESLDNQQTN